MKKIKKNGPSYLDVTQYIVSGPFSPKISPAFLPIEPQFSENLTPLSRPLYIQIERGKHSPYLKQLLSNSEIQFLDFTLDGNQSFEDEELVEDVKDEMSVIEQEEEQQNNQEQQQLMDAPFQYNPEEYVPNMHLLDIDPAALTLKHFSQTLDSMSQDQEKQKEFIMLYLTDQDLELYKNASIDNLLKIARTNLSSKGSVTRLERKAKVSRYLQKKKKRIWRKKINYDCRKKVADNRLRVKGKFVTSEQACSMLGIGPCSEEELKQLLKGSYDKIMF